MTTRPGESAQTRRALILTKEFPPGPGGIGVYAYKLAAHLHARGWTIGVVGEQQRASDDEIRDFNAQLPFEVRRLVREHRVPLGPFEPVYRLVVSLRAVRETRPDLIIGSQAKLVWIASLLGLLFRRKVVVIGYGTEYLAPGGIKRRLTRWAFGRADAVVNISHFTERLMDDAGIAPERRAVVHPGVDAADFARVAPEDVSALRARLGLDGAKVVLTVALISDRKGQDIVIRALPTLRERAPDTHYVVVGTAENPVHLTEHVALAESLGLADAVHFVGKVSQAELPAYYHLCDVFVLTSRRSARGSVEGFGIVAAEAALCGKPSVVAEGSGLVEAIVPGETGLVVAQDSPQQTADALATLLTDDTLRQRMGKAAREHAWSTQRWEDRVEVFDGILAELLEADDSSHRM